MISMSLSELSTLGIGKLIGRDIKFTGISIDSRTLEPGNLFVAIKGDNFDGHDFIEIAKSKGAAGLIISQQINSDIPYILVNNTTQALMEVASHWRTSVKLPVVAITGSNGKTTVKEMVASVFQLRGKTLSTHGNLNNEYGVPLTLLRLDKSHQYAVIEIGANHIGEIRSIVQNVLPDIAAVTMIGPSHLEGFGSIQGVAEAKSEIFSGLSNSGTAVVNRDDDYYGFLASTVRNSKVTSFGFSPDADISGTYHDGAFVIHSGKDHIEVSLNFFGEHNRKNALAAAAIAVAAGFTLQEIKEGLEEVCAVKGRLQSRPEIKRFRVIDDTYNANPASMKAALDVLAELKGVSCAVLGDMAELGIGVEAHHAEIGQYAKSAGVDYLMATGPFMKEAVEKFGTDRAQHCESIEDLVDQFLGRVPQSANVLVKGSRSAGMEAFIDAILQKELSQTTFAESIVEDDVI